MREDNIIITITCLEYRKYIIITNIIIMPWNNSMFVTDATCKKGSVAKRQLQG